MSFEGQKLFPGDEATPLQVLALAVEYHRAADTLLTKGRRGKPLSRAPYRLAAIHAIELYLNAMLRACGHSSAKLRGMHHDLARRNVLAADAGLRLRKRTSEHLRSLSEAREYLVMRYGPEMNGKASHLNRMDATLKEVAMKATAIVNRE